MSMRIEPGAPIIQTRRSNLCAGTYSCIQFQFIIANVFGERIVTLWTANMLWFYFSDIGPCHCFFNIEMAALGLFTNIKLEYERVSKSFRIEFITK
jgi:hypothetical protein